MTDLVSLLFIAMIPILILKLQIFPYTYLYRPFNAYFALIFGK